MPCDKPVALCVIWPLFQLYVYGDVPPLGLAKLLPFVPALQVVLFTVTPTVIAGLTVATAIDVAVLPPASLIVTVYVLVEAGQELMFCVVALLLQLYVYGLVPPEPLDVNVAQKPGQTELPVAVTEGPVQLVTVIFFVIVALHVPLATV